MGEEAKVIETAQQGTEGVPPAAEEAASAADDGADPAGRPGAEGDTGGVSKEGLSFEGLTGPEGKEDQGGQRGEGDDEGGGIEPKPYEFKVPEGFDLDSGMVEAATPLLQKYKVTGEDAQALADLVTQKVQRELDGFHESCAQRVEEWKRSLVDDAEVGGKNLRQNLGVGLKALNRFGDTELVEVLRDSGLEYHPAVVKFFYRVGVAISEDVSVGRSSAARTQKTATLLYGGAEKG